MSGPLQWATGWCTLGLGNSLAPPSSPPAAGERRRHRTRVWPLLRLPLWRDHAAGGCEPAALDTAGAHAPAAVPHALLRGRPRRHQHSRHPLAPRAGAAGLRRARDGARVPLSLDADGACELPVVVGCCLGLAHAALVCSPPRCRCLRRRPSSPKATALCSTAARRFRTCPLPRLLPSPPSWTPRSRARACTRAAGRIPR